MSTKDQRPDPKPRKHPQLWQSYLWWDELIQLRKRHLLRISSIEAGKSNMDSQLERDMMDVLNLDSNIRYAKKSMINYGAIVGDIWEMATNIRGLGEGGLVAQLLAQIDDIGKYDTISKLWRFAGYAVIEGMAEKNKQGEKSHFNRRLKAVCWNICQSFIKQQTPGYVDIYYAEKSRLRERYPEPIMTNGKWKYNDGHLHNMAQRKMIKVFLQHLWIVWRATEGWSISMPYVIDQMGHGSYYDPIEFGWMIEREVA